MKNHDKDEWAKITNNLSILINSSEKSKTQLANEIGIKKSTLSQYISGRAYPSLVTLKHLCKALDCEYDDVLGKY